MKEITLVIYEASSEPGYFFDIFEGCGETDDLKELDGGLCTTSLKNTLDIACEQAKLLINKQNKYE